MQSEEQRETQEKAHDEFMGGGGGQEAVTEAQAREE